ncbi:MAG: outer membrane beta-barrel protein [bacterium]
MKRIFTVLIILLFGSTVMFSQSFKVGVGGGLTFITAPEIMTNDISNDGLGFGAEYHFNAKAKFSLPVLPLAIIGEVYYTSLAGEEEYMLPVYYGGTLYNVNMKAETDASILTFGVGAQYSLIPGPISPYVSASILFNSISELKVKATASYQGVTNSEEETYGEKISRTGLGLGAGLNISILPVIDLDVSLRYNIVNMLGKEDGEDTISMVNANVTVFFAL